MKKLWMKYKVCLSAIAAIALFVAILQLFGVICIIKHLTGISCPGCGMTRACMSALRLDFSAAFAYHPLWIALPFALGALTVCKIKHRPRLLRAILAGSVLLLLAVYLWRMLAQNSSVVVFEPQNGAIARLLRSVFQI